MLYLIQNQFDILKNSFLWQIKKLKLICPNNLISQNISECTMITDDPDLCIGRPQVELTQKN